MVRILNPFAVPLSPIDPYKAPMQIRSALNQIVAELNTLDFFQAPTMTPGINSSTPTTILPKQAAVTLAIVSGTSGTIRSFLDLVAWDPINGTSAGVLASSSLGTSAADARTYSLSLGALQLKVAANTYNITLLPLIV